MKKNSKSLLFALLGAMALSACDATPITSSSNSTNNSNTSSSVVASNSSTVSSSTTNTTSTNTSNTSSSNSSSTSEDAMILDELVARVIIPQNNTNVINDFNLPATVKSGEYVGEITWTADSGYLIIDTVKTTVTDDASGVSYDVYKAVVVRPENGQGDATVRLTATVSYNGLTGTKTQKITIPEATAATADTWGTFSAPIDELKISSWEEWIAQESGTIAVQGIITGMVYQATYSNANVFLQDEDGGYYAYAVGEMSEAEANNYLAVGNEVIFEGEKSIYHGLHEFNQEKVTGIKVLSSGHETLPTDVTEAATNNELNRYQAMYVKATGMFVTAEGKNYLQFGDYKYELYHSSKYSGSYYDTVTEQLATFKVGDTVELVGMVGSYDADQFHPYDMKKVETETELTDEQKVDLALTSVESSLYEYKDTTITKSTTIELFTSDEVEITYALDSEADTTVFALEGNVLTVNPTEETKTATLTINAELGEAAKNITFTFTACAAINVITVAEAIEIANGYEHNTYTADEYYVKGTLGEITNSTYGNCTIVDGENVLNIYGMYGDDEATIKYGDITGEKPEAGDVVILKGVLGQYSSKLQMKNAYIYDFAKVITVAEAIEIATGYEHNTYTADEYYVKGTLGEITNSTYGNCTIVDGDNVLNIYGMYGDDEATIKYGDITDSKPVAGDTVILKGVLGQYSSKLQMKNAYIYSFTAAPVEDDDNGDTGDNTGDVTNPGEPVAAPATFDAATMSNIDTAYGAYSDLKINDRDFTLSCGNKYTSSGNAVAVGINKSTNLSKAGALPTAVATALGDKVLTTDNVINAALEMDFDVSGVTSVTYNFLKVGYGGDYDTTVYILRSVDAGATYSVVATGGKSNTSLSYTEESTAESVRYALVVTGGADEKYGAYARVSTIQFA